MDVLRQREQVERPEVGKPVGAGEHVPRSGRDTGAVDGNLAQHAEPLGNHLPGLAGGGNLAVDGVVDRPHGGVVVDRARCHPILRFGVGALPRQPEEPLHALRDEPGLALVGLRIFAQQTRQRRRRAEGKDVVRGRVSRTAAVVFQVVAGPNRRVRLVEGQILAARPGIRPAEKALLPSEVALEGGPDLAHEFEVSSPAQVAQKHIEEHHVHVVVIRGEVSIRVQQGFFAGKVRSGVEGAGDRGRRVGDGPGVLALHPVAHLLAHPLVLPQRGERIGAAPAGQRVPPGHGAMHHTLLSGVPQRVGGNADGRRAGVDVGVGRGHPKSRGDLGNLLAARGKLLIRSGEAFDRDVHGRTRAQRNRASQNGQQWGGARRGYGRVPCAGIGEAQVRAGRKAEPQIAGGAVQEA